MRRFAVAALFLLGALPAHAATVTALGNFDPDFVTLCAGSAPSGYSGAGNVTIACEVAVAEARGGNGLNSGDQEVTLRNPKTNGFTFSGVNGQLAINANDAYGNPGATYDFSIGYDALLKSVTYIAGPRTLNKAIDMAEAETLFIRLSNQGDNSFSLLNMNLVGGGQNVALGSMTDAGVSYLRVSAFDFTQSFTLTGTYRFASDITSSGANRNHGSRLSVQFKFTDIVTPVPVPAAGTLLLTGLAALGKLGRRQS